MTPPIYFKNSKGQYEFDALVQQGGTGYSSFNLAPNGIYISVSIATDSPLVAGKTYTNGVQGSSGQQLVTVWYTCYDKSVALPGSSPIQSFNATQVKVTKVTSTEIDLDVSGSYDSGNASVKGTVNFLNFKKTF